MHPADWTAIAMTKNANGDYIVGNPQDVLEPRLFGLPVVPTQGMTAGNFLVGNFRPRRQAADRVHQGQLRHRYHRPDELMKEGLPSNWEPEFADRRLGRKPPLSITRLSEGRAQSRETTMTKIKMIATDTFHATSVRAEPVRPDDEFTVDAAQAVELENAGLAKRVEAKAGSGKTKG
jgi:hypothetical protein